MAHICQRSSKSERRRKKKKTKKKNENYFCEGGIKVGQKSITLFNAHSLWEILAVLQNEHTFSLLSHSHTKRNERKHFTYE